MKCASVKSALTCVEHARWQWFYFESLACLCRVISRELHTGERLWKWWKNSGHCHRTPEDPVCAQVCKINLADACFCFTLLGETSEIISNFSGNLMGDKFSRLYSFDLGSSFGSSRITCAVKWRQRRKKRHFYLKFNTSSDVKKKLARQKSAAMICIWLPVCAQMRTAHITNEQAIYLVLMQ